MNPENSSPSRPARGSALGRFTRRGRLADRWAKALAEPDPGRRLRSLLLLTTSFLDHPKVLAEQWPPYLDSVLRGPHAALLTPAELDELEAVATAVAGGSKGRLTLAEAWIPLVGARDARGEHHEATAMLSRLYWSPDLAPSDKRAVARSLAERGASGDEHLAVYVDHLDDEAALQDEPAVTTLVTRCLAVGFDTSYAQLRRAGELARGLRSKGVPVPGVELALGYASMLVDRDPRRAIPHLTAAHDAGDAEQTALLGLLAALVRVGDHERVAMLAEAHASSPVVNGLAELSATLRWLDDPRFPGLAPMTAARLAALPVATHAGEWLDYAIGRLHLLEGAPRPAATLLEAAAEEGPEQQHWHYHAAWAHHLVGDWRGVARHFELAEGWPGRWTIGLLLVDANPALAFEVAAQLGAMDLDSEQAQVVAARLAMASPRRIPVAPVEVPDDSGDSMADQLEILRTSLGVHLTRRNAAALTRAMSNPVFHRLPLADQVLWSGLAHLPGDLGRSLLVQAAEGFAYPRAGLVLTVHELRSGRVPDPAWLAGLSWRRDSTAELVRAWSALMAGDISAAMGRLAESVAQNEPRGHYALANARLLEAGDDPAAYAHAATAFTTALERDGDAGTVPAGARLMLSCAALAADPDAPAVELDDRRAEIGGNGVTPWVAWTVALGALRREPADVPLETYEQLVTLLESADAPTGAAARAVAAGLARAGTAASRPEHPDAFLALLERVALTTPDVPITGLCDLVRVSGLRNGASVNGTHGNDAPTALALAERSLAEQRREAAAVCLRDVPGEHDAAERFCHVAADFLQDRPIALDRPPDGESAADEAIRLLLAFTEAVDDPENGLDQLLSALRERDLSAIVDMSSALPALCARAGRGRQARTQLEALVRAAATGIDTVIPAAVLAHCASAVGARDVALALWRQVFTAEPDSWARYAAALRHEAAVARRAGEERRAADHMLLAAYVAVVRDPYLLPPDGDAALPTSWVLEQTKSMARSGADEAALATHAVHELCAARLLTHLFGPGHPDRARPGRLRVLERLVAGSRTLCKGLLDDDTKTVRRAWSNIVGTHGTDIRFHHTLAVLYREQALGVVATSDGTTSDGTAGYLTVATALWSLLLSSKAFWRHVGEEVAAEEARLREEVCRELFAAHAAGGRRALAAGDDSVAAAHLRCLVDHSSGPGEAVSALHKAAFIRFSHGIDRDRFAQVSALASEALSGWADDVIRTATTAVTDPDAIALLPRGVSQNYAGGLEQLEPFLRLGVPVPSVLRTGLEWYNAWSFSEHSRDGHGRLTALTAAASDLADKLVPSCTKGQGLRPENQALSQHLMFRGFVTDDHSAAIRHYAAALEWNPGNANAQQLIDQRREVEVEAQFARAADELKQGRADAASRRLRSIEATTPAHRLVKKQLLTAAKLRGVLDRKDWTTAVRLAREELADVAPDGRTAAAHQLAMVLNSHAVDLADKAAGQERTFGDALTTIFGDVRQRLGILSGLAVADIPDGVRDWEDLMARMHDAGGCAVCGGWRSAARERVVTSLMLEARSRGEVRATDAVSFWRRFDHQLCAACRSKLNSITEARRSAITLLTEARQHDSRNTVIRRNLEALRNDT